MQGRTRTSGKAVLEERISGAFWKAPGRVGFLGGSSCCMMLSWLLLHAVIRWKYLQVIAFAVMVDYQTANICTYITSVVRFWMSIFFGGGSYPDVGRNMYVELKDELGVPIRCVGHCECGEYQVWKTGKYSLDLPDVTEEERRVEEEQLGDGGGGGGGETLFLPTPSFIAGEEKGAGCAFLCSFFC